MRFFLSLFLTLLFLFSLLPTSIDTDCSLKKNSYYHYLVLQALLQFLFLIFSDLSRLKFLQLYLRFELIHYFDDCCLLAQRLWRYWKCLALSFGCIFVAVVILSKGYYQSTIMQYLLKN